MLSIDKWVLNRLDSLIFKVREGYEALEFHQAYHAIHNFCVVDMSNFYLDVIKDRLYTDKKDSTARRAAQTAMAIILDAMTRLIAPILRSPPTKSGRACRTAVTATRAMSFTTRCRSSSAYAPARRFPRNPSPAGIRSHGSATSSRRHSKTPAQKSRSVRSTRRSRSTHRRAVRLPKVGRAGAFHVFIVSATEIVDREGGTHTDEALGLSVVVERHRVKSACVAGALIRSARSGASRPVRALKRRCFQKITLLQEVQTGFARFAPFGL